MANEVPAPVVFDNDLREQAAQNTLAANPLVGVRLEDILDSARLLVGQMLSSPGVAAQEYLRLLGELGRIATGGSELAPDAKDKRFADSAWNDSAIYRALAQCYLAWGGALNRFVYEAKMDKRMPNARALSSLSWSMRWRRPIQFWAIRLRSGSLSRHGARVSSTAWKISRATWPTMAACRHKSIKISSRLARTSQLLLEPWCTAARCWN